MRTRHKTALRHCPVALRNLRGVPLRVCRLGPRRDAPPAYVLISVSKINDADDLKKALSDLRPTLPGTGARLTADTDTPEARAGEAPEHVMIVQFDSSDRAQAWKSSDPAKRFEAEAQQISVATIQLAQGLPSSSGPGAARRAHHGLGRAAVKQ